MLGFVLTVLFAHNLLIGVSKTDIDDTQKKCSNEYLNLLFVNRYG